MNILEEFDDVVTSVINPSDIVNKVDNIPEIAIACFSYVLFDKIVAGGKCVKIAKLHNTNMEKDVYEIEYRGKRFVLFMIGIGAPAAVGDIEDIHEMGVNKFIVFGNCGVLDNSIDDCEIIIPNMALRDEGTSYHYVPANRSIILNKNYIDDFKKILNEFGYGYRIGTTWTTDAFYRETRKKVESRKKEGAIVVEMEAAAMQAVADFRGLDLFVFFYAGDNLGGSNWDKRSLSGEVKLDEKSRIAYLALELAYNISKD